MAFYPYLAFPGTCREAFTHYQSVFGGELTIVTGADVPAGTDPGADPGAVMHAALTVADGVLMGGDMLGGDATAGGGMCAHYPAADAADAEKVFARLSEGGTVTTALEKTFFSDAFGMCIDRFGTPWMVVAPGSFEPPAS